MVVFLWYKLLQDCPVNITAACLSLCVLNERACSFDHSIQYIDFGGSPKITLITSLDKTILTDES